MLDTCFSIIKLSLSTWTNGDPYNRSKLRSGFLKHNSYVRSIVPPERLLEYQVQEGWDPLCRFLGKEDVPREAFPRINEGDNTAKIFRTIFWAKMVQAVGTAVLVPGAVAGVAWGVGVLWRRGIFARFGR
jgi:hypothetical protein